MSSKTHIIGDALKVEDIVYSPHWRSVHPFLDQARLVTNHVPADFNYGLFTGYSMNIWETVHHRYEELLFKLRVPWRWDGVTCPLFVAITAPTDDVGEEDEGYQYQIEWISGDIGKALPDDIRETLTSVVELEAGTKAITAFMISFELASDTIKRGQHLQLRLRRIAAPETEVAENPAIFNWDTRWKLSRIGTVAAQEY